MTLPVNVATCTVVGAFVNSDGSTPTGTIEFIPQPPRMLDATATIPVTINAVPQVAALDATGAFTVTLAATDDDDLNPVDWTWLVRVRLGGHTAYSFNMDAPGGEVVDLADVTPVAWSAGTALLAGPQGEPGDPGPTGATGAAGATGATGPAGEDGTSISVQGTLSGAATPLPSSPSPNDLWVLGSPVPTAAPGSPAVAGDGIVWTGTAWENVGPIRGPQGDPGVDGADGVDGSDGATGPQGIQGIPGNDGAPGADGSDGTDGADGADGVGVPAGGTTDQVLAKNSNTDFDTEWVTPTSGVPTSRSIATTSPLTGGGDLSADRTLAVNTFGTAQPGVVPLSGGGTVNYLRADGTWTTPPGSMSGIGNTATYTYSTSNTEPPTGNQLRTNTVLFSDATRIWIMEVTVDGLDVSLGLARIKAGYQLYIQDRDNASNWAKYTVVSSTDDGTYWDFTVTYVTGAGTIPGGQVEIQAISPGSIGVTDGDKGDVVVSAGGATWMLDSGIVTAAAKTVLDDTTTAAMLTTLGAQPVDSDLTTIAGLTATTDNMIQSVSSAWASRTPAQVKTALALNNVDNTTDAGKPVSTAQATAIALKADKTTTVTATAPVTGSGTLGANLTIGVSSATASAEGVVELATAAEVLTGTDTTRAVTAAGVAGAYQPLSQAINAQTGTSYTLVLTDAGKIVTLSNAAAITLTVPTNASVAFPVGTSIDLIQLAAGQFTVTGAGPPTISKAMATAKSRAQYSVMTLIKTATDVWVLTGDAALS